MKPGDIRKTNEIGFLIKIVKITDGVVMYDAIDPMEAGFFTAWSMEHLILSTTKEVTS